MPLADQTSYSLICALQVDGWTWQRLPRKLAEPLFYEVGGPKVWRTSLPSVYRSYLLCLLDAERLQSEHGIQRIEHGRTLTFYNSLLKGKVPSAAPLHLAIESDVAIDVAPIAPASRASARQGDLEVRASAPGEGELDIIDEGSDIDIEAELEKYFADIAPDTPVASAGIPGSPPPFDEVEELPVDARIPMGTDTPIADPVVPASPGGQLVAVVGQVVPEVPLDGLEFVREMQRWGPFRITPKRPSGADTWGRWEVQLPNCSPNA